ncbi:McrC family protein [Streptococcus gallolyticus]|nr:McrC family protein [Streptococcus gallolyticus]MBY5040963.1 McrC family protein [Streptococcus gallolyticus]
MNKLILKDNDFQIAAEKFETIPHLTQKIANKTLEEMSKENLFVFPEVVADSDDLIKEQMVLQSFNTSYRTSNLMGFIGFDQEKLTIQSRFSEDKKDFFFQYLFSKVFDFPNLMDLTTTVNQDCQDVDMLYFLFPYYLEKAMRKGLYKTYVTYQKNDSQLKGVVEVARHLRENSPFHGNIAYRQREFSSDNTLMQLVRHTIEAIQTKSAGRLILKKCSASVKAIIEATVSYHQSQRHQVMLANQKQPLRHAYFREYRELQRLCLFILQGVKNTLGDGHQKMYGVLFDGAWLWEEYVNLLIGDCFYHPMNKSGKEAQRLFTPTAGLIYPDFISKSPELRIVADAKYKRLDTIRSQDYSQVLTYMFRFDAKTGYYLYPEEVERESQTFYLNTGSSYEKNVRARTDISIIKLGLHIPRAATYEEFVSKMKLSEDNFRERIGIAQANKQTD